MHRFGTRHHTTRSAVVIGMILALALAVFARPASAAPATTARLATAAGSSYPIVVIETAKASLTVAEVRRLAEQATHRTLPASPDRVWFADTGGTSPTRGQVDALIAGQPAPGLTVLRTVDRPAPQRPIGDLCAGLPDGVASFWGWLIFIVIVIIRIITHKD